MNPFETYTEAELKKARRYLKGSLKSSWQTGWAFILREVWQSNLAKVEQVMQRRGIELLYW